MGIKYVRVETDKIPRKDNFNERYSTKQKYEVVVLYKMIGNLTTVAKHKGIPVQTLHEWHTQDWWFEIEEEIRKESKSKIGKNLQNIVDKAFEEVQDRLEHGDWLYDQKQGKMIRKPVGAHTANQILNDGLNKTFFIEKLQKEEKQEEKQEEMHERLLKLSKEFEKYTKAREIVAEATIEIGDAANALHDERKAGLQEGEPPLQIETGADSSKGSSEQSTSSFSQSG